MRSEEAFQQEQERRERAAVRQSFPRLNWFKLELNDQAKIRFLGELKDGLALVRHRMDGEKGTKVCFRNVEYGEDDCPYCALGARALVEHYWPVYNYTKGQVEVLAFRETSYTPVTMLRAFSEDSGTIQDRDYTIRRVPAAAQRGGQQVTAYVAIPAAPTPFTVKIPPGEIPSAHAVSEILRPREIRS